MEKEIKFIKAWIIYFIVNTIGGFMVGFVTNTIFGLISRMTSASDINPIVIICGIARSIFGLSISFICFKWSIKKFILTQVVDSNMSK